MMKQAADVLKNISEIVLSYRLSKATDAGDGYLIFFVFAKPARNGSIP